MTIEIHGRIINSIHRSTGSCYMMFGQPCPKVYTPSLSIENYLAAASHPIEQFGIDINTRRMVVIYSTSKRAPFKAAIKRVEPMAFSIPRKILQKY